MRLPTYRIASLLYAGLSLSSAVGLGWALARGHYYFAAALVPAVLLGVVLLSAAGRRTMRKITFMFNAVENDDYSFCFRSSAGRYDDELNMALNRIHGIMLAAKRRAREKEKYYELIMEQAGVGLLVVNERGNVFRTNSETLRLFGLPRMTHIDQLRPAASAVADAIRLLRSGDRRVVSYFDESGEKHFSLACTEFVTDGAVQRIVAVGNIDNALSAKEVESWSRLTRILTHEIMNSLAPITSLSETLCALHPSDDDMGRGLRTIAETSRRLVGFTENFRRFTRIPAPQKELLGVRELLEPAVRLAVTDPRIAVTLDVDPADTMIYADRTQVSQVVVNLLKNAVEALAGSDAPAIAVTSRIDAEENVLIEVADNGHAIPREVVDDIFTPFFTTKPDGSGIGLSVSRQIMLLHNGSLRLAQNTDSRVAFTLVFR